MHKAAAWKIHVTHELPERATWWHEARRRVEEKIEKNFSRTQCLSYNLLLKQSRHYLTSELLPAGASKVLYSCLVAAFLVRQMMLPLAGLMQVERKRYRSVQKCERENENLLNAVCVFYANACHVCYYLFISLQCPLLAPLFLHQNFPFVILVSRRITWESFRVGSRLIVVESYETSESFSINCRSMSYLDPTKPRRLMEFTTLISIFSILIEIFSSPIDHLNKYFCFKLFLSWLLLFNIWRRGYLIWTV